MKKLILPVLYNRISIYTNRYINVCILESVRLVIISITCSDRDVQLVVVVIINK